MESFAVPDTHAGLFLRVLGPVQLTHDGTLIEPSAPKVRALLLALAFDMDDRASAERLIDEIWGTDAPSAAKSALHTLISRTRSLQPNPLVKSVNGGYALALRDKQIDIRRARGLLNDAVIAGARNDQESVLESCRAALELFVGEAGIDTGAAPIAELARKSAESLRRKLERLLGQALVATNHHEEAVSVLSPLLESAEIDESLQASYLLALAGSGRSAAALTHFGTLRRRLREQLGSDPSPQLQQVHQHLLNAESDHNILTTRPLKEPVSTSQVIIGVKASPNELLGRAEELDSIQHLLNSGRLTTILGPGGLGKTRMAQEVAHRAVAGGAPAVVFVELAGVRSADDIWYTIADTLGIREANTAATLRSNIRSSDLRKRTLRRLAESRVLLIIDNCEHVIDTAALVVADILDASESVTVLATSRSPLSIPAERVHHLNPLSTSVGPRSARPAAVELFYQRALAARPGAVIDDAVAQRLCARLDGLPLAIELAAAKIRVMSVHEIERRLSHRFDLLVSSDRTAPERHRTLMAVIDWSWNLLDDAERTALRRLSCFPDGFTMSAAQAVTGFDDSSRTIEDSVEGLVTQSLVLVQEGLPGQELRYRMLETVREFGLMSASDAGDDVPAALAMRQWAVDVSQAYLAGARGAGQLPWLRTVRTESDNLQYVLRAAIRNHDGAACYQMMAMLCTYWSQRGMHPEVISLAGPVLAATAGYEPDAQTVSAAVITLANLAASTAFDSSRLSLLATSRIGKFFKLGLPLDPLAQALGELAIAFLRPQGREATLAKIRQSKFPEVAGTGLIISAMLAENASQPTAALRFALDGYRLASRHEDTFSSGSAAAALAQMYGQSGQFSEALRWSAIGAEKMRLLDAAPDLSNILIGQATYELASGDWDEAERTLEAVSQVGMPEFFAAELRSTLGAVRAEIALSRGEIAEGLALYRQEFPLTGRATNLRGSAQLMVGAAAVGAELLHVADAALDQALRARVHKLRRLAIADYRMSLPIFDGPILGTPTLVVGSWAAARGSGHPVAEVGLELMGLAQVLASRQDYPSLNRNTHLNVQRRIHGPEAVETAVELSINLEVTQAHARVVELLRDPELLLL